MARCKECIHYAVCGKQRFVVQIDARAFSEYNQVDGVEKYCYEHESTTALGATRAEIAREIFDEIENSISPMLGLEDDKEYVAILATTFAELKNKYTGESHD